VAHLGELDAEGRAKASALAARFAGKSESRERGLFDDAGDAPPPAPVSVRLDQVRVERGRCFGDVWLAWTLWQALELDTFCEQVMPEGREQVSWPTVASILAIARFCEPSSELHIAEDWYRRTALEDLLGVKPEAVNHKRLYAGLDQLLPHKAKLESHLKRRYGELFDVDFDLMLYDVTSTYFEGEAKGNPMAKRGYSRDNRPDCKQVCIALIVTREGLPIGHEVFDGNRTDVTTVEEIVETMEERHGKAKRVWVMDRGMVSEANIEWLRAGNRQYLVGAPKSELKKWQRELIEQDGWEEVRKGLEVKVCDGPEGSEVFLLCRSAHRKEKDKAMQERFSARIVEGLESLARRLKRARQPADRSQVERQIGRLLQRNSRAAARFRVIVKEDTARGSGLRVRWSESDKWNEWARLTEGAYVLRSNVAHWTGEELWNTYVQLQHAENAFRIQKTDLKIRPVWHQRAERVRAHIFVCFLAYAMWKTLEGWQRRAGLGASPRTVIQELARLQSVDVVLPLETGPEMRVRCVVRPERETAVLLQRLGLRLPKRLRGPSLLAKM
jgi:transposase